MNKKSFLQPILFGLITILFASCDKDFNELGTNIVDENHYGFELYTDATVKAYNQKLGPIASNNLPINALGFYNNPAFGTTQANFVTQLELSSVNPTFNNTDVANYGPYPTVLDSVVMEIPYFKKFVDKDADDKSTYTLDSIYGEKVGSANSKFRLDVFQSNYFLRDLDPGQALASQQPYYTDENSTINMNSFTSVPLNDLPTTDPQNADGHENSSFYFSDKEHKTTTLDDDNVTVINTRSVPSMRLHLNKAVFANAILTAPAGKLADQATFKNYFRGIYFKVTGGAGNGNMAMINFKGGKITLYYNEGKKKTSSDGTVTFEKVNKSFALNLTGNSISLLENSFENPTYLATANSTQEASKLYLKGGEGSMAIIDLFGSVDTKGYVLNPSYNENMPISSSNPKYNLTGPNGISDEIDDIKFNGWLINEANLTFYIDKPAMSDLKTVEPNRIYLYDLTHKKVLIDYAYDFSSNSVYPKYNKAVFGGYLLDKDGAIVRQIKNSDGDIPATKKGTKYKLRITSYVRSLVKNDSINVRLGLSVTESINTSSFSKLRTANSNVDRAPSMSVLSPTGTLLYGSNIPLSDPDYDKRVKLEIYYTKP